MDDEQKNEELETDTDALANEEEAEEEMEEKKTTDTKVQATQSATPTSWIPYFAIVGIVILLLDWALSVTGASLYWSEKRIYFFSYLLRFIVFLIATSYAYKRIFSGSAKKIYLAHGWLGLVTGILLAAARYVNAQTFWTFLNMLIEPFDGLLVAFAASYLVYHYKNKLNQIKV